ncbi:malonate decarboxylase holo-ACP synthase [Paenisporosarcina antarctica]|uniref:Malonate decarboxylase holo-ACP synthase n=1 Tax=Paenisporosarcina antarctica TaxID=417367 RepID=A0A4P6ZVW2_9BACL|nr:malonate decarboxylase holo-ACP synthase [Paenisporosarcina antarctica]QBP40169.1 malonate decarboxylase holo-ACP synthase [Paenisporosarcina antarctica]
MELNTHDLLEFESVKNLISNSPLPEWVETSIANVPFVVVRRAKVSEGLVPVGVRGPKRNERFAAFLPVEQIVRRITPEQLAQERKWNDNSKEIFNYLGRVSKLMNTYSLNWGPVGSVGFELASGKETTTKSSDIDIVIRFSKGFTTSIAKEIEAELKKIQVRVDVQMEAMKGTFSLSEYAISEGQPVLFRTVDGPLLKRISIHDLR